MLIKTFKSLVPVLVTLGVFFALSTNLAQAHEKHKLVLQVNEKDPQKMSLALNNAANVDAYYKSKGEEVTIEIITYGPGLNMLIAGKSPVEDRIKSFEQNFDNITFHACNNTKTKMEKKSGKSVPLISQANIIPSGVIRLSERQEEGWTYIRP
jgi:intracellular sulfur oxidation DsrE/DsrF family protein